MTREGAAAGRRQSLRRATGDIALAVVHRAELGRVAVCLLEVVADDLVELDQVLPVLLQPGCESLVQLRARGLGQPFVGGVPDEQMPEAEGVLAQ